MISPHDNMTWFNCMYVGAHSDSAKPKYQTCQTKKTTPKNILLELPQCWPRRLNLHIQQWPRCNYRNHWFCWILFLHYHCFSIFFLISLFGSLAHWTLSGIACKCRFLTHCSIRSESSWAKTGRRYSWSMCACVCEMEEESMCLPLSISRNSISSVTVTLCYMAL